MMKKLTASFKTRSLRVGGYSVVATAIVLAIIITANLLVGALPTAYTQWDITANQFFSISELTQQMLKNLQTDVTVYWVCQSGVEDTSLQILLDRYVTGSSHVKLEKIDPDLNPTFVQKYPDISFTNNSLVVMGAERYRYVDNEDIYREEMDYTTYEYVYTFDGENALTSAIDYVTATDLPKLYTLSGHQEVLVEDEFKRSLELENFLVADLNLSSGDDVPEDADMVMIFAPFTDLTEAEVASLGDYLAKGGDLLLLSMPTESNSYPNLYGLLERYGVSAVPGVVFEGNTSNTYYSYPHYLVPNINSHSITQPLIDGNYGLMIPEAHGLAVSQQLPENTTVTSLLETSAEAYSKTGAWPLEVTDKEEGDLEGPFGIAVAIEQKLSDTESTKIVWVSSVQLLSGSINSVISGGNLNLFMNSVNWASDHADRISIRAKNQDVNYLNINSASAVVLNVMLVAIIPLCVLVLGVVVFVRRKYK